MKGYIANIEQKAITNQYFREVLYTGTRVQLVIMSLNPLEDIGEEVHDLDQFIRVEEGEGIALLDGEETSINAGSVIIIPEGVRHNIVNRSATEAMKLYTLYTPPHHKDGTIHRTKDEAAADTADHFNGTVSE